MAPLPGPLPAGEGEKYALGFEFGNFDRDFAAFVGLGCWCWSSGRASLGVFEHRVDDVRMNLQHKVTQNAFVDFPLAIQRGEHRARTAEVEQPIRAFALAFDRVRQAAFFP